MATDEILLAGRLNGIQRNRLKRLLNMMYKPRELAEEVGFSLQQVYRVYVPGGCPVERDNRNHIWINGEQFRDWYKVNYQKRSMKGSEAFCLTCKKAVEMQNKERREKDGLDYYVCDCPVCGRRLARIVNQRKRGNDQSPELAVS
jgi:hypothetical protein